MGKGKSSGGKPPELLSVVPESEYYMGVDIGRGTIRLVLMNLAQKVVYGPWWKRGRSSLLKHLWTGCASGFRAVCWNPELHWIGWPEWGWRCPASSSGIPGHILFSPDFGWSDIPLQSWLQSRLSYPVLVENANRALALAESGWRGDGGESGTHTVLCVNIGHGYRCSSDAEQSALLRQQRHQR